MSMYDKNHYNIVISLKLIKINDKKKELDEKWIEGKEVETENKA